jgi:prephenate dehydrogenase
MEERFTNSRIVIAGLGLIGGSVAKALHGAGCAHISALDTDTASIEAAKAEGVIEAGYADNDECFDMVICALPPQAVPAVYERVKNRLADGGVFAELSGLKSALVDALYDVIQPQHALLCLHPMAGSEKTGFAHSKASLFHGAPLILTSTEKTTDTALEWAKFLCKALQCGDMTQLSPALHDAVVADLSHLPHVAALAVYAVGKGLERFAGGSFHAITRVADLNAPLWAGLLMDNAEYLQRSLARLKHNLDTIDQALAERDTQKLEILLSNMAKGVNI